AGAACEAAEKAKAGKYRGLGSEYDFVPFGVETLGPWGPSAIRLFKEIAERLVDIIGDRRAGSYLGQRITLAIQRGNAASNELSRQLDLWLSKADLTHGPARAIIAPHAGYSYCGACAAFAYRQVSPVVVKRIFILGPSHHVRLGGCALSSMDKYQTPLYDLIIDKQIYAELEATRQFEWMDTQTDEDEHSIEMHLPYIAKVMEEYKTGFTIIPILVGSLTPEKEAKYGAILAPYLADPQNLVVVSSDFCHWGQRFRYTWRDPSRGHLYQGIEWLDRQGMDIIEKMEPRAFTDYLNKYGNTICGRHPIGVLLQAVARLQSQQSAPRMTLKFLKYAQSSQCMNMQDSSVSYASASLVFE
ncbi:hypothetical protein evm_010897, partial [Chilo suppressalis]